MIYTNRSTAPAIRTAAKLSSRATDRLYERTRGAWSIIGCVSSSGRAMTSWMTRLAEDGTLFSYVTSITATPGGMQVSAEFAIPLTSAVGSLCALSLSFDGQPAILLRGDSSLGLLRAKLPDDISVLKCVMNAFKSSHAVAISVLISGLPVKTVHVDLEGFSQAFNENGTCTSAMIAAGMKRISARNG